MADKKSASSSDHPDTNSDDENVTLTEGELDDIVGGAEVSEVTMESPLEDEPLSLEDPQEGSRDPGSAEALSDELPELPSLDLEAEEGLGGDLPADEPALPSLDDMPGIPDAEASTLPDPEGDIPEDLPSPEEVRNIELPDLSAESSAEEAPEVLENANPADELPALEDMELPDLSADANPEGADEEDVEVLDAPSDDPAAAKASGEDEDETIALSNSELDNILSDVDETQVLDLEGAGELATEGAEDDEIVSVSGEELDSITQDVEPVLEDDKPEAGELSKKSMEDSVSFEAEIMEDAQVQLEKPEEDGLEEPPEDAPDDLPIPEDLPSLDDVDASPESLEPPALADASDDTGETPAEVPAAQDDPEGAFDEIQAIPAPPEILDESDAIPEETLEAIDLDEVHQATRPVDEPAPQAPEGAWDGTITEQDFQTAASSLPAKPAALSSAPRPHRAAKVDDRELYELLKYLDTLLEKLPEQSIREFAESRFYDRYIALINRLGI